MKTAIMTEPVGMFKNLSPDYDSYIKDPKAPGPRPGLGAVKRGYLDILQPRDISKEANALTYPNRKTQYRAPRDGSGGFAFKGPITAKDLMKSQIILKAKADKIVKSKEAGKEIMKAQKEQQALQKGTPLNITITPFKPVDTDKAPPKLNDPAKAR